MKNQEIWKPIKNYENFYEVSNFGRVRSVDRTIYFKNGKGSRKYKGQILKQKYHNGYAMVNLNKNKDLKVLYVHRLVAETFLDNPNEYKCVNHIDGIKANNASDNLEWCTSAYNNRHARENGLVKINIDGILECNKKNRIAIMCTKGDKIMHISDCSRSMARWLKNNIYPNINPKNSARVIRSASSRVSSYKGYGFERVPEKKFFTDIHSIEDKKLIIITKNKNIVAIFENDIDQCTKWLLSFTENVSFDTANRSIRKCLNKQKKKYHGFQFNILCN